MTDQHAMDCVPGAPEVAQLVHVGRQPIYDLAGAVVGYELLFRSATETPADRGGTFATGQVIVNAFTEFGVSELVGDRLCFLNLTRHFLVGELPLPFGPEQVVLEVLETVAVDDRVVAGVMDLAARGYRIALDDFVFGSGHEKLLGVASYVKLDLLDTDEETVRAVADTCRSYPNLRLVGERLETQAHLDLAKDLGCDLLQGYLLGRPQVLSTQALSPSRLARVQLMTTLLRTDVEIAEIVDMVIRDPALSFRLLGACNSAASALSRKVSSVHEAVVLLGTARVRQWVSLMALNDLVDADEAQLMTAISQARMCQLVAERLGQPGDPAFTAGLLIGVAGLLGVPVTSLTERLPLSPELVDALTEEAGPLGRVIGAVRAYEDPAHLLAYPPEIPPALLAHAYLSATGWSTSTLDGVLGRRRAAPLR